MKHFTITSSASKLTIKRNLAGILHLRLALIVSIIIASGTIAFLVNGNIKYPDKNLGRLFLIFGGLVGLSLLIFYRDFFKNSFTIQKSGDNFLINHTKELPRDSIEYILEEGYSTKDHVEGYKKIRIKTTNGVITIGEAINPADGHHIKDTLLSFFEMDASMVRSLVW